MCNNMIKNLHIHLNKNLTSLSPNISGCSAERKALGNVCVKRLRNQPTTLRRHRPLVCCGEWVCVCVWGCLNGFGWTGGCWGGSEWGKAEGKLFAGCTKVLVFQISAPPCMLYSETWSGSRPLFGAALCSCNCHCATLWRVSTFCLLI